MTERRSRLRRTLSRWADNDEAHARDLRAAYVNDNEMSIGEAPERVPVRLQGTIKTVTLRPRGGTPALEAELEDGTGAITLVWLGRRRISGIEPGRSMRVEARIGSSTGQRVMFNPRYELLP